MDSSMAHSPVFLVFPPEITASEYESTELSTTTFSTQSPLQKLFATKMKIIGTIQILFGIMTFSFGVIFLFTLLKPYPRFPFIFLSGYPFWGSVLFINSGAFLIALKRKTTETLIILTRIMNFLSALGAIAGIILLTFGFMLDQNYICGYSQQNSQCNAVTVLFMGILIALMTFSIIELLISLPFSIVGCHSEDCDCEQCC
ncbi:Testis-expressed transmembrane protein 4 [Macaca mulatta]|uniref:Testis-expressed transmembrane protein 4 n=2 Tax=Macaca mulatta TaxID=9544 RepID=A0A8J8Y2M3_MACMU|nr:membrane-spanning 4-domains subfamily A member 5 [Macaca mulatta]XP_015289585.2 membrane-spanning 4-domains subfamily A member 5 [Macaca fascicularis]EHH22833.1 Testis-expressed transmembrane protein 4 [Macaca mulatta]